MKNFHSKSRQFFLSKAIESETDLRKSMNHCVFRTLLSYIVILFVFILFSQSFRKLLSFLIQKHSILLSLTNTWNTVDFSCFISRSSSVATLCFSWFLYSLNLRWLSKYWIKCREHRIACRKIEKEYRISNYRIVSNIGNNQANKKIAYFGRLICLATVANRNNSVFLCNLSNLK